MFTVNHLSGYDSWFGPTTPPHGPLEGDHFTFDSNPPVFLRSYTNNLLLVSSGSLLDHVSGTPTLLSPYKIFLVLPVTRTSRGWPTLLPLTSYTILYCSVSSRPRSSVSRPVWFYSSILKSTPILSSTAVV